MTIFFTCLFIVYPSTEDSIVKDRPDLHTGAYIEATDLHTEAYIKDP